MMGPRQEAQSALFYDFSIDDHVPTDHVLRAIDGVIDLSSVRTHLTFTAPLAGLRLIQN